MGSFNLTNMSGEDKFSPTWNLLRFMLETFYVLKNKNITVPLPTYLLISALFYANKKYCFNNIFTLKSFHISGLFPYLLQVFCIFRGYRKKPVTWNGLVTISCWIKYVFSKVHIMVNKVYWRCFSSIFNVCKIRKGLLNLIFQKLYRILQKWTFKNLW